LYGASLDLRQLKNMIDQYLTKLPNDYNVLKTNISIIKDNIQVIDGEDETVTKPKIETAKKILTLVSGVAKLKEVLTVSDAKGSKKDLTFITVIQTIVGGIEKMEKELLGSAAGMRESAKIVLKLLPWSTLFSLFSKGKNKLKSDIEIMVNTFMLLINILGEMYSIAKGLGLIESIKNFIIERLKPLIPMGKDRTTLTTIKTNIEGIIKDLKTEQGDTSKFQGFSNRVEQFFGDIRAHAELEFTDILDTIKEFVSKLDNLTSIEITEINDTNIETTLNNFKALDVPTTSQGSRA
jgi:hypothetical protein